MNAQAKHFNLEMGNDFCFCCLHFLHSSCKHLENWLKYSKYLFFSFALKETVGEKCYWGPKYTKSKVICLLIFTQSQLSPMMPRTEPQRREMCGMQCNCTRQFFPVCREHGHILAPSYAGLAPKLRIAHAFNSGAHLSRSSSMLAVTATTTLAFKHHPLRAESFSQTTNKVCRKWMFLC